MKMRKAYFKELDYFFSNYFVDRDYFICIYGSYVNGHADENSDVDLLVASTDFTKRDLDNIKKFVISFHKKHNLSLDNEVPYDVKLLITYRELNDAINLKGFKYDKNGDLEIPKVEKNKDFLESYEVKLRLALNALTSPHIMLGNDNKSYERIKARAEKAIYKLANDLVGNKPNKTNEAILNVLLYGQDTEEGEMYLGYKNYPSVVSYLSKFIDRLHFKSK